jgi:hypothetical protein
MTTTMREHVIDETGLADLVGKIQAFEDSLAPEERTAFDGDALNSMTGLSETDLQRFLEEQAGLSPDEEAQGSLMAAVATAVIHC